MLCVCIPCRRASSDSPCWAGRGPTPSAAPPAVAPRTPCRTGPAVAEPATPRPAREKGHKKTRNAAEKKKTEAKTDPHGRPHNAAGAPETTRGRGVGGGGDDAKKLSLPCVESAQRPSKNSAAPIATQGRHISLRDGQSVWGG